MGLMALTTERTRLDAKTNCKAVAGGRRGCLPDSIVDWKRYIENRKSSVHCKVGGISSTHVKISNILPYSTP